MSKKQETEKSRRVTGFQGERKGGREGHRTGYKRPRRK